MTEEHKTRAIAIAAKALADITLMQLVQAGNLSLGQVKENIDRLILDLERRDAALADQTGVLASVRSELEESLRLIERSLPGAPKTPPG